MLNNIRYFMVKSAIIASTADGYDILIVIRDLNGRKHNKLYKNVTAATMRRYYRLTEKINNRPSVNITTYKEIVNIWDKSLAWKEKYLY